MFDLKVSWNKSTGAEVFRIKKSMIILRYSRNNELCNLLIKKPYMVIQLKSGSAGDNEFLKKGKENDILFELSINNKYHEIMDRIEKEPSSSVKACIIHWLSYTMDYRL